MQFANFNLNGVHCNIHNQHFLVNFTEKENHRQGYRKCIFNMFKITLAFIY